MRSRNNDPLIFLDGERPANLACKYTQAAQNLINGRDHTFGHMHESYYGGRSIYASHEMVQFEHQMIINTIHQYSACNIRQIHVVSTLDIFAHIWGGLNNVPRILKAMYGTAGVVAIPEITEHQGAVFRDGPLYGRSYDINAIHGLTFDREHHLWALYQVTYPDRYGRPYTNDNDPESFTWDYIVMRMLNFRGGATWLLLDDFWKFKMVNFILNNHFYQFPF